MGESTCSILRVNAATDRASSLSELEKEVEQHKKKLETEMQNYCTSNPAQYAKVKRENSNDSDQGTKVFIYIEIVKTRYHSAANNYNRNPSSLRDRGHLPKPILKA
ncbi:hypothetical protein VKS41_008056 [Umbelopsis sp. WA50703]